MQNPIENYKNQDFLEHIDSLVLKSGSKEGYTYYYFDLVFKNGFSKRIFLKNEDAFALKDLVEHF